MTKSLLIAVLVAFSFSGSSLAQSETRKKPRTAAAKKAKTEVGASCKAPAIGACASCGITCRPGETATCVGGLLAGDMCQAQPSCKCTSTR